MKVGKRKYIFLVLYVDDILLATNDTNMLIETKQILFNHFLYEGSWESVLCLGYTYTSGIDLVEF